MKDKELPEYIEERLEVAGECLLWGGPLNGEGYPVAAGGEYRGRLIARTLWELFYGPLDKKLWLYRACPNGMDCVNPKHKEVMLRKEMLIRYPNPSSLNSRKEVCPVCGTTFKAKTRLYNKKTERQCPKCTRKKKVEYDKRNREKINEQARKRRKRGKS